MEEAMTQGQLENKIALVTGGASGIGAACATLMSRRGARVVIADVLERDGEQHAQTLREHLGEGVCLFRRLDVTSEADWRAAVETAEISFGGLDVLVNGAGISGGRDGVVDLDADTWHRIIEVNQTGTWQGMQACVPALHRRGGGAIINIASIYGIVGTGASAAYHATKGAVRLLTKTASFELGQHGIRVNSVHPGYIHTPMTETLSPERIQVLLDNSALRRGGSPEEAAAAVCFLASDDASFVTGSDLLVDGGYTAG